MGLPFLQSRAVKQDTQCWVAQLSQAAPRTGPNLETVVVDRVIIFLL